MMQYDYTAKHQRDSERFLNMNEIGKKGEKEIKL